MLSKMQICQKQKWKLTIKAFMTVGKFKANLSIQLNLHSHRWLCQNATSVSVLIRSPQRGVRGRKILFRIGEKDCAGWKFSSHWRTLSGTFFFICTSNKTLKCEEKTCCCQRYTRNNLFCLFILMLLLYTLKFVSYGEFCKKRKKRNFSQYCPTNPLLPFQPNRPLVNQIIENDQYKLRAKLQQRFH